MQILCISGKIGSGKTTISKKIIQNISRYTINKKYILYVNIDHFANTQKNKIYKQLQINTEKLQKQLFYFGSHKNFLTEKTWNTLNTKFKPVILHYIKNILEQNTKNNYSKYKLIIFDIALQNYFTEAIKEIKTLKNISYINLDNKHNSIYTKLFLLQKYRKISFQKTLKILQQQV
jgi:adenylate kinase family enzyme